MRYTLLTVIVGFALSARSQDRIINGEPVGGSGAPWQLSLQTTRGSHFCGAVLITPRVLLTAAHCVWLDGPDDIRIRGNSQSGKLASLKSLPSVKKIIIHPKFERQHFTAHDLAIIVLSRDIDESETLQPVPFLRRDVGPKVDESFHQMTDWNLMTTGWGVVSPPNMLETPSEQLMAVQQLPLASSNISILDLSVQEYLSHHYQIGPNTIERIRSRNALSIITEGPGNYGGTCSGDSGGPLVGTYQGKTYLLGIASYTAGGEKRCTGVSVYTNIQAYEEWIHTEIGNQMAALFIDTTEFNLL